MQESEIILKIRDLQQELIRLSQTKTYEQQEVKNGLDVYTHEIETTVGTKEQITNIKNQISQLEQKLEKMQKYKEEEHERILETKREMEESKKQKLEQEKLERKKADEKKKEAFKKVKQAYKKVDVWSRFVNKIKGRTPNWKKVQGYSQEELEYLLRVSKGNTVSQQERFDRIIDKNNAKSSQNRDHYKELQKQHQQYNNDIFTNLLNSESKLEASMNLDENKEAGRRR